MKTLYIAADPGKNGAYVCIDEDRVIVNYMVTPRISKDGPVDLNAIYAWLIDLSSRYPEDESCLVLNIEDVHALYGVSVSATSSLMENKGQIHGLFAFLANQRKNTSIHFIPPKEWQKTVWMHHDKVMKAGKVDTKATSLNCAKRLWANEKFLASDKCKKAHDGIVDALLIAETARRLF